MHPDSMRLMAEVKRKYLGYLKGIEHPYVCDDGGLASNPSKSYRHLFPEVYAYLTYDIVAHPSVDVVKPTPFTLPTAGDTYDLVLSGQMLEHCQNPFKAVAEMKRVLKTGCCLAIIVPSAGRRHDAQDGWRFMDDAFKFISAEVGGFETLCDFIDTQGTEEGRGKHWRDHVWVARKVV
jgi:SAM-dependent methyltransferase